MYGVDFHSYRIYQFDEMIDEAKRIGRSKTDEETEVASSNTTKKETVTEFCYVQYNI